MAKNEPRIEEISDVDAVEGPKVLDVSVEKSPGSSELALYLRISIASLRTAIAIRSGNGKRRWDAYVF